MRTLFVIFIGVIFIIGMIRLRIRDMINDLFKME